MDEGEGLGLKMELYKANGNGSHTGVRGPPLGLYMTPEGPLAKHEIFHLTIFHHKMWGQSVCVCVCIYGMGSDIPPYGLYSLL